MTFSIGSDRPGQWWRPGRARAGRHPAGTVDVEDLVEPAQGQPRAHAQGQVDQLVVGEAGVQPVPEGVVHAQVIGGVALGELGGQLLPLAEPVRSPRCPDRLVERLGDLTGVAGPARARHGPSANRCRWRTG